MSASEMSSKHVDEITLMLYVERQLDREAAQEVSVHTQTCARCLNLLRVLDRESRLLTRAMLEQDEPLPAKLVEFRGAVKRSMQWLWGAVFAVAVLGVYALYTGYVEPWQQQLEQAGFGSTNLLSLLVFQGAFWKGWQSMFTLIEFVALAALATVAVLAFRKYLRRGSALAMVFASVGLFAALASPSSAATEFRKGQSVEIKKDEVIKGDLFVTSEHVRMEGTIDGDIFVAGKQVDVTGHVTGDVICACQSLRIGGQVDGNVRNASNNLTLTGTVSRSITSFTETLTIDSSGKIGHSLTTFTKGLDIDGSLNGDLLGFVDETRVNGSVGGDVRVKGNSLSVGNSASFEGKTRFEGDKPPDIASGAKFASPLEYKKLEHRSHTERGAGYYIWRIVWASAYLLFGLVLLWVLPLFSREAAANVEQVGASFGLGVLVGFALPIAAFLACITIVGLFVGLSSLFLWYGSLYFAQIIVGTAVGQWILGRTNESWPLVGRMAIGVLILRIAMAVPFIGTPIKIAVIVWGIGAISLAVYRRLQPVMAPNIPSSPMGPVGTPLPPGTTVGGAQPA